MQTHNTNNRIKIHEQAKKKMPTKIHDKNAHALELRNASINGEKNAERERVERVQTKNKELTMTKSLKNSNECT